MFDFEASGTLNMTVSDSVFISDRIRNKKRVIRRFRSGKIIPGIYIIRQADLPDELEIIRAVFFKQKFMAADPRPILSFTKNYDEAVAFVIALTQKSVEKYGYPQLMRFLNEY